MFFQNQQNGSKLPANTICLTFDDGPGETLSNLAGPKTLQIGHFLMEVGITATFFCVGKSILQYPHILPKLFNLGHTIGNHTFNHPVMTTLFDEGRELELLNEKKNTHSLITEQIGITPCYFRAPYGKWKPEISIYLNKNLSESSSYRGPFHWDIFCHDYLYWDQYRTAEECANAYLFDIEKRNKGIILMHDSTVDNENMRLNNRTFETIQIIVPILKNKGYTFVGIDELVPRN